MAKWNVDTASEPGLLRLTLEGKFTIDEMRAFAEAHNRAIDGYGGRDYKVWCDISKMTTLTQDCAAVFEAAKQYSNTHKNFRGSAVLVSSAVVALQHRRTSVDGGVIGTEMISQDVRALYEHLRTVYRKSD